MRINHPAIGLVAILVMVVSSTPPALGTADVAPANGELIAFCNGNSIQLYWGSHPNANSNGLQKGDSYTADPNQYWGWLPTTYWDRSYTDYNIVPGVTYQYRVKYTPDLPSNTVTVSCPFPTPTWTPTPYPTPVPTLKCSPVSQSARSGEDVSFRARGGTGSYYWNSNGGIPADGWGSSFTARFYNYTDYTQSYFVTVTNDIYGNGGNWQTTSCEVRVAPHVNWPTPYPPPYPTPYPTYTPYPAGELSCATDVPSLRSGQTTLFTAYGGDESYTWTKPDGSYAASGRQVWVQFYNYDRVQREQTMTVRSGWQTARCSAWVQPDVTVTPYPTPYPTYTPYPTWTPAPTPVPATSLSVAQDGRNLSAGQSGVNASLRAKGNDTVQFTITVRNTSGSTLSNVRLTDILPSGLAYVWGSTTVNGIVVADGATTSGRDLGALYAGQKAVVRLSAVVDPASVPASGTRTVYNAVQVSSGGNPAFSNFPVVLSTNRATAIGTASGVKTGPTESAALALAVAALVAGAYALYTRTELFGRRYAHAAIRTAAQDKSRLNFARLL